MFILNWPTTCMYIFVTDMIATKADPKESLKRLKNKLMPAMIASWKFLAITRPILYGLVPFYIRNIACYFMGCIWGAIFSYI